MICEDEYLGFVAATLHMFRTGTVAGFATLLRGTGFLIQVVFQWGDFSQLL